MVFLCGSSKFHRDSGKLHLQRGLQTELNITGIHHSPSLTQPTQPANTKEQPLPPRISQQNTEKKHNMSWIFTPRFIYKKSIGFGWFWLFYMPHCLIILLGLWWSMVIANKTGPHQISSSRPIVGDHHIHWLLQLLEARSIPLPGMEGAPLELLRKDTDSSADVPLMLIHSSNISNISIVSIVMMLHGNHLGISWNTLLLLLKSWISLDLECKKISSGANTIQKTHLAAIFFQDLPMKPSRMRPAPPCMVDTHAVLESNHLRHGFKMLKTPQKAE